MIDVASEMISYAKSFIGTPYKWGGDDPMAGYDCSGLVQEVLASVGLDPKGDQTAQALYNYFKDYLKPEEKGPKKGSILFFGTTKHSITHTSIALDHRRMLEAGGGGSKTVSLEAAIKGNAFIKIRPIRFDLVASFDVTPLFQH